jgi:hypothetical protein
MQIVCTSFKKDIYSNTSVFLYVKAALKQKNIPLVIAFYNK